jgi:probable phosphoglycerate mutase
MRHCQTFGNATGVRMGVKETQWSTLSLKGVSQAISIANRLSLTSENFSEYKFIASPLVRTQQTLRIILELLKLETLKLEIDPLISSKNKGIFEGIPKEEMKRLYPEEIEKKKSDRWNYKSPGGGESLEDLYQRILKFVNKHENDKNVVVAVHETGCKTLLGVLQSKTREEIMGLDLSQDQNYFMSWDGKEVKIL